MDILFTPAKHDAADNVFNIQSRLIEQEYVAMRKSTPLPDGSTDFLSSYTVIAGGKRYHSPPDIKVVLKVNDKEIGLVPAEKILVFKLISRRSHHQDLEDVRGLTAREDFDSKLFWDIASELNAERTIEQLLESSNIPILPR